MIRCGPVRQVWVGEVGRGGVGWSEAGKAALGAARSGKAGAVCRGQVEYGKVW